MAIFHSYVGLPEGKWTFFKGQVIAFGGRRATILVHAAGLRILCRAPGSMVNHMGPERCASQVIG